MIKTKVYHVFHGGLEHHNKHMLPLFQINECSEFSHILVCTDPHYKLEHFNQYQIVIHSLKDYITWARREVRLNDVIVVHGMYSNWHYLLPFINVKLAKRVIWEIWGDDYFSVKRLKQSKKIGDKFRLWCRKFAVPKLGALAGFQGDVTAASEFFGFHNNKYDVNHPLREQVDGLNESSKKVPVNLPVSRILIGNSGSRSNEHARAVKKLLESDDISCMALYFLFSADVDHEYKEEFQAYLASLSDINVHFIEDPMPFDKFIKFVESMDVVVMPHRRQQGVGTTNLALLLNKPVFMDLNISTANYYHQNNIRVFDVEDLNSISNIEFSDEIISTNKDIVLSLFGRKGVVDTWYKILRDFSRG